MKETRIRLNMDDVHDFVKAATKCDFDIDVRYNRFLVDAKSILGVLSMDLGQILIVKCHGENSDFDRYIFLFLRLLYSQIFLCQIHPGSDFPFFLCSICIILLLIFMQNNHTFLQECVFMDYSCDICFSYSCFVSLF